MLIAPGLFLFLLSVLQVTARYKNVIAVSANPVIRSGSATVSSSESRITWGWVAQPGQHPHHATLRVVNSIGELRQCGGSILSKDWLITAGQCTARHVLVVVRAGVVAMNNPEYIFDATEWYHYPEYDLRPRLQQHDISLVKLTRPVVFSKLLQPIRVQSRADAFRNYNNVQVYASGHGRTSTSGPLSDVLRWVYLLGVSNSDCARPFGSNTVFDTTVCARYFNVTAQSVCHGDIGGPLVHVGPDGVPTLIGVHVFVASAGCDIGLPTGFTRTGPYLSWFEEITGLDFENLQEDDDNVVDTTTAITTTTTADSDEQKPDDSSPGENTTANPDDSETQEPNDSSPEENTTAQPDESEDQEEDKEEEEEESNEDDDLAQLLKRLEVNVKVKVAINKYNMSKEVGKDLSILQH